jgi:hypothetical protein
MNSWDQSVVASYFKTWRGQTKMEANETSAARIAAKIARKPDDILSRVICPGGVGFETSSAKGHMGAGLVANSTRAGWHGVSVADMALLLRIRFALQEYAATETKAVTAVDLTKRQ